MSVTSLPLWGVRLLRSTNCVTRRVIRDVSYDRKKKTCVLVSTPSREGTPELSQSTLWLTNPNLYYVCRLCRTQSSVHCLPGYIRNNLNEKHINIDVPGNTVLMVPPMWRMSPRWWIWKGTVRGTRVVHGTKKQKTKVKDTRNEDHSRRTPSKWLYTWKKKYLWLFPFCVNFVSFRLEHPYPHKHFS